ncbi:MAG: hypothetical protein H5T69_12890 [Chloroflexi bacterium]|nr:hypothetical protein [Chloroflexota bacterium]
MKRSIVDRSSAHQGRQGTRRDKKLATPDTTQAHWMSFQQRVGNRAVQRALAQCQPDTGTTPAEVRLPTPAEVAWQYMIMERLRRVAARYVPIEELTPSLRRELRAFMGAADIERLALPIRTVDEFADQVLRLRINLVYGAETPEERLGRILQTPTPQPTPPTSPSGLPEWLSLYAQGMVGFHVTLNPVPGAPLEASLTAPFRERGLPVDSRLLQDLMTNYETGLREIEGLLQEILPAELSGQVPTLAEYIAQALMNASLSATLQAERPTPLERAEQQGELIQELLRSGQPTTEVGPLRTLIGSVNAGVSITLHF